EPTGQTHSVRTFRIHESSPERILFEVFANREEQSTDLVAWSASPQPFSTNVLAGNARLTWSRLITEVSQDFCACDGELIETGRNVGKFRWLTCAEAKGDFRCFPGAEL